VDAPLTDSYAITFTDEAQKEIIVRLSAAVKPTNSTVGLTVHVNCIPASIASVGYGADATQLMLTLSSPITYADRNTVRVSYNSASGTVEDYSSNKLQAFTNHAAVNNLKIDANLLEAPRNIGTAYLIECAPVQVKMTFQYSVKDNYRNSIYFSPNEFEIRIWYDDLGTWR